MIEEDSIAILLLQNYVKAFSTTFSFEQLRVKFTEMLADKYLFHYLNLPVKRR